MSLKDRLDEERPEGWKPGPGGELIGRVVNITMRTGGEYADYPIYTIKPDGGGRAAAVHAFHTALRNQLEDEQTGIGDEVAIRYIGFQETPEGNYAGYHDYRVAVEHPAGWAPKPVDENADGQLEREAQEAHEAAQGAQAAPAGDDDIPF